jgi:RNA polymerase sigma factor (sigma-70 family)
MIMSIPAREAMPRLAGVTPAESSGSEASFEALTAAALAGNPAAWEALVERLKRVVWRALGSFNLRSEDRKDVFAATFARLYEHLATIREPEKLPGWMATTARNEAIRLLRSDTHMVLTDRIDLGADATQPDPAVGLIDAELHRALHRALGRLSPACQDLLRLLTVDPPLSYAAIGKSLNMPHGSIGPNRQRCLERLRQTPELRPFVTRSLS